MYPPVFYCLCLELSLSLTIWRFTGYAKLTRPVAVYKSLSYVHQIGTLNVNLVKVLWKSSSMGLALLHTYHMPVEHPRFLLHHAADSEANPTRRIVK